MTSGQEVTIRTLVHMAKQEGWPLKSSLEQKAQLPQKRRLKPFSWEEADRLPKREHLIKSLLDSVGMSVVFGESNCGKTFFAIDIAVYVTLGLKWCGLKVRQGAVVYIAAEGGMGLQERLKGQHQVHKLDKYPPFHIIPVSVDLCNDQKDTEDLISEIRQIDNVRLVIIDTLSRAMAGGNENSPDHMGAFIKNCDKIREETKAHVLIIHHSGKDSGRGARGHSALKAAVDTEIEVKKDRSNNIVAEVTKQRDGKTGVKFGFELKSISIGVDEDGEPRTSCVLAPAIISPTQKKGIKGQKKRAADILKALLEEQGEMRTPKTSIGSVKSVLINQFRDALKAANIIVSDKPDNIRRSISQIIIQLKNANITETCGDLIWLADEPDKSDG